MPLRDVQIKPLDYGEYQYNPKIITAKDDTLASIYKLERELNNLMNYISNYSSTINTLGYSNSPFRVVNDKISFSKSQLMLLADEFNMRINKIKDDIEYANIKFIESASSATDSISNEEASKGFKL